MVSLCHQLSCLALSLAVLGVPKSGAPLAAPLSLDTGDGLRLEVSAQGRITGCQLGNTPVKLLGAGGFAVADFKATPDPATRRFVPCTGRILREGNGIRFESAPPGLDLALTARLVADSGRIRVEGEIEDRSNQDRALCVAFRLPFDATGWTWHDDIEERRTITEAKTYANTYTCLSGEGICSIYPVAAITGKAGGLSLALPLSQGPRVFLLGYDGAEKAAFVRFYFGLTRQAKKWPGRAAFAFDLYRHDPRWGMRSAWQRYYNFYPESFRKRPRFEGYLNYANLERFDPKTHRLMTGGSTTEGVEDASDFGEGYRFLWHLHGCYDFRMVHTPQRERLSDETVYGLLRQMVAEERTRPRSYCPTEETMKKIVTDAEGRISYIGDTRYWNPYEGYNRTDKPGWGLNFRVNEDPEISSALALKTREALEAYAREGAHAPFTACLTADAIEGYFANQAGLDYRPEHLAVSDAPLTFGKGNLKPAIANTIWDFHRTVWGPLSEKYQVLTYGNSNGYEQAFTIPFVDIVMFELYRTPVGRWERFLRTMAYQKILRSCYYRDANIWQHLKQRLAYAIFPSVYAVSNLDAQRAAYRQYIPAIEALSAAGWEPVPYATTNDPDVVVERFGRYKEDCLHFTLRNYSAKEKRVTVTLDPSGLGIAPAEARTLLARDILSGNWITLHGATPTLQITLEGDGSAAVAVGTARRLARKALRDGLAGFDRIERLFSDELTPAHREMLDRGRRLAREGMASGKLLQACGALMTLLDELQAGMTSRAPVDLAKVLFRIRNELSAGAEALVGCFLEMPRLVSLAQGEAADVEVQVANTSATPLDGLRAQVLSPWPDVARAASLQGLPTSLVPKKRATVHVSLVAPAQPERKVLPYLVSLSGTAAGQPFRILRLIDAEVVPSLSFSLVAPRLFPGAARRVWVRVSNASHTSAEGVLRFGDPADILCTPSQQAFRLGAGETANLAFEVRVDPKRVPGSVPIVVSTTSADPRFVCEGRLSLTVNPPVPQLLMHQATVAPRVDGDLSDPIWQEAATISELVALETGKPVTQKTTVRLTYNSEGIFVAFHCAEANMRGLVAQYTERGSPLYLDDDVEVFVLPSGQSTPMQFAVNALGTQSDNIGNRGPWRAGARRLSDAWSVEIFIPYEVLGVPGMPETGTAWGFQFGRQQKGLRETSAWTVTPFFNSVMQFGEVLFQ